MLHIILALLAPIPFAVRRVVTVPTTRTYTRRALSTRSPLKNSLFDSLQELSLRHENKDTEEPPSNTPDRPVDPSTEGVRVRYFRREKAPEQRPTEAHPAPVEPKPKFFQCYVPLRQLILEPLVTEGDKARVETPEIKRPLFWRNKQTGEQRVWGDRIRAWELSGLNLQRTLLPSDRMSSSIQLVTVPTADTPGTMLILQTQRQHYIFGSLAEGSQRAMSQMGTRLLRVQDFFITGKTEWANAGGIIGLALTLADSASSSYEQAMSMWRVSKGKKLTQPTRPKLNFYGPPNLKHLLGTCRRFIFRKGLPIAATEYKTAPLHKDGAGLILPTWQDENIKVWALTLTPTQAEPHAREEEAFASKIAVYEQFQNHFQEYQAPENESREDRESRYDRIRTAVLKFMFDSDWKFDTLVERHISEVEMPTTMFIRNPDTHRIEPYSGPVPGGQDTLPDIKVLTRTPWPGAKVIALPPTKPALESMSYIVRAHDARGVFDAKRAKELGIKPGPLFGQLSNGTSVQNDKGETITSDQVVGPDREGQGVAIMDVPSVEYLDSLLQRQELHSDDIMKGVKLCFWLLGPGVSGHPTLRQIMQKLDTLQHVVSSVDDCTNGITLDSVTAQTIRLAQIDPVRYHVPFSDNVTLPQKSLYGVASSGRQGTLPNVQTAQRGASFNLMPRFERKENTTPWQVNLAEVVQQVDPDSIALGQRAQWEIENDYEALRTWRQLLARPDTEVITLGTGSALPSKYRNVSATLLRVPGIGNYLLDCGENTLGQLQRVFNPEELVDVLKHLRVIWISHLHADHHLGTVSVIKAWYKIVHNSLPTRDRPMMSSLADRNSTYGLSVISHGGMIKFLTEYSAIEDFGFSRILPLEITPVENGADIGSTLALQRPYGSEAGTKQDYVLKSEDYETVLGLLDIQACRVKHCFGSMGVSFTFPQSSSDFGDVKPLKVSYSGDCRPSHGFTVIGRDSTVLIHEATFDDELSGDAKAKKHSTTSEALGVGARMDAKAVVLTHFSQRYQKIPILQTMQDGDQEDALDNVELEDFQANGKEEGDDNVDARPENNTTAPALPSDSAQPPQLSLRQQEASKQDIQRVIKVRSKNMKVAIAFDYMRVKIGEIAQLEKFNEALTRLFAAKDDEEDGGEVGAVNSNGKKTSGDEQGGRSGKKKKNKRND